jgi:hypothetical protein
MLKKRPKSLLEFQRMFPTEDACSAYLWQIRWPNGFVCPRCGSFDARQESGRKLLWGCRGCGKQTSLIAGTIMQDTELPLPYWFWGAYLVVTHSNGISALQLWKQLKLGSYKTAWLMLNKLRRAMVDPELQKLSGVVEVDEAYIPFRSKDDPDVDSRGRSPVGKMVIGVAVEVIEFTAKNGESRSRPVRIRIEPLPDTKRPTLHGFIRRNIEPGSGLVTDNNKAYLGLKEYYLRQTDGSIPPTMIVPWADRVISLVKTLALGTYHGYRRRYIRRYLDEFVWRFNRRHYRPATFHLILGLATKVPPAPLSEIVTDPIDNRDAIIGLPAPPPGKLPEDNMLERLKARRFRGRGFMPPEDFQE